MQSLFVRDQNVRYNKLAQNSRVTNCNLERESYNDKTYPCFLNKDCSHVKLTDYTSHLTAEHKVRMSRPFLPVVAEPFRISYKYSGTDFSCPTVIWKYFGQAFSPLVRINGEQFSFGVICIGLLRCPDVMFTVKMKFTKPCGSKFFNWSPATLKFKVPISPMDVASDGTLETSAYVVLNKHLLGQICKKSTEEGRNEVVWEWDVTYEIDLSD